jgi:hypothetical protein
MPERSRSHGLNSTESLTSKRVAHFMPRAEAWGPHEGRPQDIREDVMRAPRTDRTGRRAGSRAPKDLSPKKTKDVKGGRGRYQLRLEEAQQLLTNK